MSIYFWLAVFLLIHTVGVLMAQFLANLNNENHTLAGLEAALNTGENIIEEGLKLAPSALPGQVISALGSRTATNHSPDPRDSTEAN